MESRQKCMECGTGYYEENKKGKMACSKCGAVMESKKKAKKDLCGTELAKSRAGHEKSCLNMGEPSSKAKYS